MQNHRLELKDLFRLTGEAVEPLRAVDAPPSRRVRIVEGLRTVRTVVRDERLRKALVVELQGVEALVEIVTLVADNIQLHAMIEITVMSDEMTGKYFFFTLQTS